MRLLRSTTEADMIAVFLKTEIASNRFSGTILALLEQHAKPRTIVEAPNLSDQVENAYRRRLLDSYRAYVFEELPDDITWHRAALNHDEVKNIRYIDYSYWNELSSHTRLPYVATEAIRAGRAIYGQPTHGFLHAARALREGACFPELIVVGASPTAVLTVYEGHLRLTAYMLAPECIPNEHEVIAGFSPQCARI